jgi:predicted phage terminase large subunit-like protein
MHAPVDRKQLTPDQLVKLARYQLALARENFYQYRLATSPHMIDCWWQRHSAAAIQDWWRAMQRGERPMLVLGAPPQHGKSEQIRDLVSWIAGQDPDRKIMFTSYSNQLGVDTNLSVQRKMSSAVYRQIFPLTRLGDVGTVRRELDDVRVRRTGGVLEFVGRRGSFRNTTVQGQINGQGLDVGVIDDPIKGRLEAMSKTVRDSTWSWLTDDFYARFSKSAGMIIIMTRWHVDDPVGRWLERFPRTRVLNYQAIAEEDDWSVREGYREAGEALFPEHKPLDFLLARRRLMTEGGWQSEYQQSPIIVGGGLFPIDKLETVSQVDPTGVLRSVRYWDKAGTSGGGAYTAGVLMHALRDGRFVVAHVARGRWSALERERLIKFWARADSEQIKSSYEVVVEQEPGSGGKESAEATIRNLSGYRVFADRVTGSKETRAEPFAAQVQGGNVVMLPGSWHVDYLDEMQSFPSSKFRDQCDASSGAFNRLTGGPRYSVHSGWLD